ncbi:MAG: ABC transporter substrate-binding protein, partial [Kiritimatiellae bacterium]|nr:ABC transporter substrate-binding protein [Kiritimatiellia bacterium]
MNKKILLFFVGIICLAIGIVFIYTHGHNTEKQTIFALIPLTGSIAEEGKIVQQAINLYTQLEDSPFNIVFVDSESNPSKAITAIQHATVKEENPIVLTFAAFIANAVIPAMKDKGGFVVTMGTIESLGLEKFDNYQRISHGAHDCTTPIADYAAQKFSRVAVIYSDEDYGTTGYNVFKQRISEKGVAIISANSYGQNVVNMRDIVSKSIRLNPDAVFVVGLPSVSYMNVFRELRALGFGGNILVDMAFDSPFVYKALGEVANGIISPCFDSEIDVPETNSGREFKIVCQANTIVPNFLAVESFDAVNILKRFVHNGNRI